MCARRCTLQTAQCLVLVICSTAGALQDVPHELVATCVAKTLEAVDGKVAALVSRVAVLEEELSAQAQTTSKLEKTIASQQAELVALRAEPRSHVHTDGEPEGRRLSAPTTQRSMWHESIFHKFDVPDSTGCGLHAELHSSAEPLLIGRASTGNLTMKYSAGVAFSAEAPFIMTHPSGCTRPTLTLNADTDVAGTLSVGGVAAGGSGSSVDTTGWVDIGSTAALHPLQPLQPYTPRTLSRLYISMQVHSLSTARRLAAIRPGFLSRSLAAFLAMALHHTTQSMVCAQPHATPTHTHVEHTAFIMCHQPHVVRPHSRNGLLSRVRE